MRCHPTHFQNPSRRFLLTRFRCSKHPPPNPFKGKELVVLEESCKPVEIRHSKFGVRHSLLQRSVIHYCTSCSQQGRMWISKYLILIMCAQTFFTAEPQSEPAQSSAEESQHSTFNKTTLNTPSFARCSGQACIFCSFYLYARIPLYPYTPIPFHSK